MELLFNDTAKHFETYFVLSKIPTLEKIYTPFIRELARIAMQIGMRQPDCFLSYFLLDVKLKFIIGVNKRIELN